LFKCNIKNTLGELNANLTLNIESESLCADLATKQAFLLSFAVVPVIRERPKVIKIVKKRTVVVECHVQSQYAPQCTWFKETTAVRQDSRHFVHVEKVKEVKSILLL
jgi:hypothetical protein